MREVREVLSLNALLSAFLPPGTLWKRNGSVLGRSIKFVKRDEGLKGPGTVRRKRWQQRQSWTLKGC